MAGDLVRIFVASGFTLGVSAAILYGYMKWTETFTYD